MSRRQSRRAGPLAALVFSLSGLIAVGTVSDAIDDPASTAVTTQPSKAKAAAGARHTAGPAKGTLIAVGGGNLGREIVELFIESAGGRKASFVYVPTAMAGDLKGRRYWMVERLKRAGCTDITILHTRDPKAADREAFVKPLRRARGVWFSGGRQWRFADAYLNTKTVDAFHDVLRRGGVIGGSSAGATIQASYLVRGAPQGNQIMMALGHEEGFGFLENAAIDQHVIRRGRLRDMIPVIRRHPHLLGIGIDEGTAIVVRGNRMEIIGESKVAIYDHARFARNEDKPYILLSAGEVFDLKKRKRLAERP